MDDDGGEKSSIVPSFRLRWLFYLRIFRMTGTKGLIKLLFTIRLVAGRHLYGYDKSIQS